MRIVFIGTTLFGLRCLETLLRIPQCTVVGAIAAQQTFKISYRAQGVRNVTHADISGFCASAGVPCMVMSGNMHDVSLFEEVRQWKPDAFLVAGWYHMIPAAWRELAPAYGLHGSLLPDYKGGAPLVWSIINGEKRTGITLFQLGHGVDDGPIVGQAATYISDEDTIASLYARVQDLGVALLELYIPQLADGSAALQPQEPDAGRVFPQRVPEDGIINWTQTARQLYDFIRAQTTPYPGAFSYVGGRKINIWSSRIVDETAQLDTGRFRLDGDRFLVGAGDRVLELLSYSIDGQAVDAEGARKRIGEQGAFDLLAQPISRPAVQRVLNVLRGFWRSRRDEVNEHWDRTLPFADYIVDRWEKARLLGFGEGASIYDSALVIGNVSVGDHTWIGPGVILDGSGGLSIGAYCSIAAGAQIYTHDTVQWSISGGKDPIERVPTRIGDRCYIGPNVIVTKGITIGDGCVVGASSLVLSDLPPGSKAVGAPARVVGWTEGRPERQGVM